MGCLEFDRICVFSSIMSKRIRNIAIGIVLWTAFANAGDPKRADKLFNEALALSDKGNYLLAAEKYEASGHLPRA